MFFFSSKDYKVNVNVFLPKLLASFHSNHHGGGVGKGCGRGGEDEGK